MPSDPKLTSGLRPDPLGPRGVNPLQPHPRPGHPAGRALAGAPTAATPVPCVKDPLASGAGGGPTELRRPRLLARLRSQGLGVLCAQLAVLLLAIGSFVIAATRDGASAELRLDEIRPFFESPALAHSWFYLLVPVLGLYSLNTLLCTWDSTLRRWRAGQRSPRHHGPALVHLGLLAALLAHLVGGLASSERAPLLLGADWQALGDGRHARLRELRTERFKNGQPRQVYAELELRAPQGPVRQQTLAYNQPLSSGWGAKLWLLAGQRHEPLVQLTSGTERCTLARGRSCMIGKLRLTLTALYPGGHWGNIPAARLFAEIGGQSSQFFLKPGESESLPGHRPLRLEGIKTQSLVVLRQRSAPGNPLALLASLLLLGGCLLMGRRWLRP